MPGLRWILIAAAAFASAAGALGFAWYVAVSAREPERILFVTDDSVVEQRALLLEGAQSAAKEYGVCVLAKSWNELSAAESRDSSLPSYLATCDGAAFVSERMEPIASLEQVAESTKLITVGRRGPVLKRLCHIETGAYHLARLLTLTVQEALPDGGAIALVSDAKRSAEQCDREAAFRDVLNQQGMAAADNGGPGYELIEYKIKAPAGTSDLRTFLARPRPERCVIDFTGDRALAIVEQIGKTPGNENVRIITLDQSDAALAAVADGSIYAVIAHDSFAYGYRAVATLTSLCRCGTLELPVPDRGTINLPPVCLRRENVAEFRTRLRLPKLP